jgi:hypothetical protein
MGAFPFFKKLNPNPTMADRRATTADGSPLTLLVCACPNAAGWAMVVPVASWIPVKVRIFCPWHDISTNGRKKQISASAKIAGDILLNPFSMTTLLPRQRS